MVESIIWFLIVLQIQGFAYTVYIHRYKIHQLISVHPIFENFCLLLVWLTSNQIHSEWWAKRTVARHIKHHSFTDTVNDPHSPAFFSLFKMVRWNNAHKPGGCYYISDEDVEKYGKHVPIDNSWITQNIIKKLPATTGMILSSLFLLITIDSYFVVLPIASVWGLAITSGFLTSWLSHIFGYQNFKEGNNSKNQWPWAVLQWGEELHNNHHHNHTHRVRKATFSEKWYEFDLGYAAIKLLSYIRLVKIH